METLEALIAVYIVRFGIALAGLVVAIICWIRITRLQRLRMTLPNDLTANVSRLGHEVASVNESLRAHVAKEDMRINRAEKKAAVAAVAESRDAEPMPTDARPIGLTPAQVKFALNRAVSIQNNERRGRRSA